jgi:hypothetical protein
MLKFFSGVLIGSFLIFPVQAQKAAKKEKSKMEVAATPNPAPKKEEKKDGLKTIQELTEKCQLYPGLFPLFQDTTSGKTYIEISEDKLGKEFIYFKYALDGVLEAGYFRGAYRENKIFSIHKYFDKLELRQENTDYYFSPSNELSKASGANINQPLLASEKIVALSVDTLDTLGNTLTRYLIEADAIFLQEVLSQIKPSRSPSAPPTSFSLGNLSSKKTRYIRLKNYPANTDVEVEYVYDNPSPLARGSNAVTDARFVTVKVRHTLIEVPQNDYRPRYDDPRVGYFLDEVTDMTSTGVTPYRDMLKRWHLVKKDPTAALSEPVEPITFWMESTTPAAMRPIIKEAVEGWNIAFEAAGFKNAVVCLEQPDTADWDAGDIRYNVLRWTSSPNPPFGGYGPSFSNPRTGQLIGADIMLEWVFLTNRLRLEKMFDVAGMDHAIHPHLEHLSDDEHFCMAGHYMHHNILYGTAMMQAMDFSEIEKDTFITQALKELVLHEVGHTLGLNHNFIGSAYASNEKWQDKNYGATVGMSTSVMDYTIPNISPDNAKQGLYFDVRPGLYDIWAIRYGYTPYNSVEEEMVGLASILSESIKPEHRFFNDADDMRSPGKGIDPRVMINDMTADPIGYALAQNDMNIAALKKLKEKYAIEGQSFHELRNAYLILTGRYTTNLGILSRWVGGVLVDRSFAGQQADIKPFTPVPVAEQKRAMKGLAKYAFAPDAFSVTDDIFNYLQMQRRGYNTPFQGEDPKLHERVLSAQKSVLDHLLHINTQTRIIDSRLYGNQYALSEMMADLTSAIIHEDIGSVVNSMRQHLQAEYVGRLLNMLDNSSKYPSAAKAIAFVEVDKIRKLLNSTKGDSATVAHRQYLAFIIDQALKRS